ncbi:hypothetical protein Y032_0023g794 [Ancylostoma ceylanicum]|uniref:Uncharacterized protein n=1 Tax=Ancylostoma ceylanicum TaxID=53326 RepID=A0A016UY58_9BILA|nr:hypothetical protein Y032_0023g794 [Ancylostoma ceylanicum]
MVLNVNIGIFILTLPYVSRFTDNESLIKLGLRKPEDKTTTPLIFSSQEKQHKSNAEKSKKTSPVYRKSSDYPCN